MTSAQDGLPGLEFHAGEGRGPIQARAAPVAKDDLGFRLDLPDHRPGEAGPRPKLDRFGGAALPQGEIEVGEGHADRGGLGLLHQGDFPVPDGELGQDESSQERRLPGARTLGLRPGRTLGSGAFEQVVHAPVPVLSVHETNTGPLQHGAGHLHLALQEGKQLDADPEGLRGQKRLGAEPGRLSDLDTFDLGADSPPQADPQSAQGHLATQRLADPLGQEGAIPLQVHQRGQHCRGQDRQQQEPAEDDADPLDQAGHRCAF